MAAPGLGKNGALNNHTFLFLTQAEFAGDSG